MPDRKPPVFQTVVHEDFQLVNQCILEQLHSNVALVNKIGQYIISSGGKRLRPLLVLLTARACGYQAYQHISMAAIIEFLHTATLLHDDVVDQSNLRRGRGTANAIWGNAPSVLVGDFLYSRAFQMMVSMGKIPLLNILADATNVIAEGEVMQLMNIHDANVTEANYMDVIRCKTAMLFEASTHTAAIVSGVDSVTEQALKHYGNFLGTAFQLVDDVLDYNGNSDTMGKNLGDDLAEGKPTLPLIYTMAHGLPEQQAIIKQAIQQGDRNSIDSVIASVRDCGALNYTMDKARGFVEQAINCLSVLPESKYRDAMIDLASFAVERVI
ncbi:MAG: octaprenyl diphosphate synthase [Endozoicomonas sp. (ex Botrylloides leachii)]|nr:octaprenyl diphosphate synthase [Endozoicomonas sp. (ex Botrylloides leachii)]